MSAPLIAICIGHSRRIDGRVEGGAVSVGGISEHAYNLQLAGFIHAYLTGFEIPSFVVSRYEGGGYSAAQRWLAGHLKDKGATAAVELHFNSSDLPRSTGHEWLFWASSKKGRLFATELEASMTEMFPLLRQRDIKPIGSGDRGAEFLRLTHCPSVICEPFFGSNPSDWEDVAMAKQKDLALAIANGIRDYVSQV